MYVCIYGKLFDFCCALYCFYFLNNFLSKIISDHVNLRNVCDLEEKKCKKKMRKIRRKKPCEHSERNEIKLVINPISNIGNVTLFYKIEKFNFTMKSVFRSI